MEIQFVLWNIGHNTPAAVRQARIREQLKKWKESGTYPDFILAQEITSRVFIKLFADTEEQFGVPIDQLCYNNHALVFNDPEKYTCTPLDDGNEGKKVLKYFFHVENTRYQACTVPIDNEKKILLVSWHGIQHDSEAEKREKLLDLLGEMKSLISEKKCSGFIIGGDFNITYEIAKKFIEKAQDDGPPEAQNVELLGFTSDSAQLGDLRPSIDYILVYPRGLCSNIEFNVEEAAYNEEIAEGTGQGNRPFHHIIIRYKLTIESEEREELVSALRESQISRPLVLKGYATETLEWDYLTQCMEEIKALVAEKYKRYGVELEEVDPEE